MLFGVGRVGAGVGRAGSGGGGSGPALPVFRQIEWTTGGAGAQSSWIVPDGVTSVAIVTVGKGSEGQGVALDDWSTAVSGSGGGIAYHNAVSVTPGERLSIIHGGANHESHAVLRYPSGNEIVGATNGWSHAVPGVGMTGQVKYTGGPGVASTGGEAELPAGSISYLQGSVQDSTGVNLNGGSGVPFGVGCGVHYVRLGEVIDGIYGPYPGGVRIINTTGAMAGRRFPDNAADWA